MKILLAHNFYRTGDPGGEDVAFCQEKNLLERNGFEVVVYKKSNDDICGLAATARTGRDVRWSRGVYEEMSELLLKEKPDVAHFHNTFPLITASAYDACRLHSVPVVQTLHNYRLLCLAATHYRDGSVCERCKPGHPLTGVVRRCYGDSIINSAAIGWMLWRNWRDSVYTRAVDVYVALTQFAARKFIAAGISSSRVVVKPNFVEVPESVAHWDERAERYMIFAGRLSREKGVYTLLNAWRSLHDVPLKIVGQGPAFDDLRDLALRDGLPVEFLGMRPRQEVLNLIAGAYAQVVPSEWYEGFPLVVVEAYGCAVPVIGSNIGGLSEVVDPESTGKLFICGNAHDLAAQVREVWCDVTMRARLSHGARMKFEKLYTPERNIDLLRKIYATVARRHLP